MELIAWIVLCAIAVAIAKRIDKDVEKHGK